MIAKVRRRAISWTGDITSDEGKGRETSGAGKQTGRFAAREAFSPVNHTSRWAESRRTKFLHPMRTFVRITRMSRLLKILGYFFGGLVVVLGVAALIVF